MRPVTLNLGGIQDPVVLAALNEIQRASQDTLQNDQSSSGNAMATLVGASADEIAYFTSQYTTAFTTLTAYIRTLLAAPDAATARSTLGTGATAGTSAPTGRLTLTSGVAVTASDVGGATTIYYTPATGNVIPIYDGSNYASTVFAELSNVSTNSSTGKAGPFVVAANKCYFLLVWSDAGTIRLTRSPAWSSDTSVGTGAGTAEIEMVGGFWLNKQDIVNGPLAHRGTVVGGFRSNAASQMVDSFAFRWVSNTYNVSERGMRISEPTATWAATGSAATYRQANGNSANQLDWFQALDGGLVTAEVCANFTGPIGRYAGVGIDIDALNTTALSSNNCYLSYGTGPIVSGASGGIVPEYAEYKGYPGKGRHIAIWKEMWEGVGSGTWYGNAGGTVLQSGISGEVWN